MKTNVLTTFLFLFACMQLKAQERSVDKKFGFEFGANYSNMIFSHEYTTPETMGKVKPKPGVVLGFIVNVPLASKLTLQSKYLFSIRNAEIDNSERNYKLTYFSIPLFLKYKIAEHFAVFAGPQADLMIFSKRTTKGKVEDLEHQTEERNVNVVAGVDYNLLKRFHVNAQYLRGLTHIGIESNQTEFNYEIGQLTFGIDF